MMKARLVGKGRRINVKAKEMIQEVERDMGQETRLAMIQMLIPLGLQSVERELQAEVLGLAGERHARGGKLDRWGSNPGSVYLGDQKVAIRVPRVRDHESDVEVPLEAYERLQSPRVIDDIVLARAINGISQGKYERAVLAVPETFGVKKTSVCRRFIRASAKRL